VPSLKNFIRKESQALANFLASMASFSVKIAVIYNRKNERREALIILA
jgi:hypothetical protein